MINLTKHAENDDTMANHNFDFRKNANGQWELLLLSSSVNSKSTNCSSGYSYCGVYALGSDLSKKNYTQYIENREGAPHQVIDDWFVASVLTGNAQFDPNGDILYSSYHQNTNPEESALIHHQIRTGVFSSGYDAFERLRRENTATGAIRYSGDFSKLAVANGGLAKEVSICTPNHSREYLTISSIEAVDMITTAHNTAYIVDFAWDYASNLYACVRNSDDSAVRGVWVMAWNLNGEPVITPARENQKFRIPCTEANYTVTCRATEGGRIVNGFNGGTQKSCTEITVKAEPESNNYKFDRWTDQSGKTVSTSAEYTFRVVKDVQLTAHFSDAVFNVTWWNLFQGGEDITKPSLDGTRNARLWYLVMPYYNQNNGTAQDRGIKGVNGTEYDVVAFMYDYADDIMTDMSILGWLGEYIKSVVGTNNFSNSTTYSSWAKCMYAFINRVGYAKNENGAYTYTETDGYSPAGIIRGIKNFSSTSDANAGDPSKWRPWWTQIACELDSVMNYSDDMPVAWETLPGPNGTTYDTYTTSLPTSESTILLNTPAWYKWNTGGANQLLAWREGSTTGPIVHNVYKDDMALYASYVNRHISESQDNYDVIRLMQNSNYASNPHTVTVDRKLQAGMYNTICLPFSLDITTLHDHPLKDAEVLNFTGIDELYDESGDAVGVLQFETVTRLEAGKPYLIKVNGQNNITEEMIFENVAHNNLTYVGGTQSAELSGGGGLITFHAMISPDDIPAGSVILVSDNRLAKVTTKGQMLGLRGYFTIDDAYVQSLADEGKLYLSVKKPVTTSIPVAPEAEQQTKPEVRKVMYNGQIYILRGEEIYTVTGHRVK